MGDERPFYEEELIFAEDAKCPCGALLAYPKGADSLKGFWDCSEILLGKAVPQGLPGSVQHTDRRPFIFWKIKSRKKETA